MAAYADYTVYKDSFMDFYNSTPKDGMPQGMVKVLEDLKQKWDESGLDKSLDYYFGMKDHHTVLNFPFMENENWNTYIHEFTMWRAQMMMMGFMMSLAG